jgi:hypothetical protein
MSINKPSPPFLQSYNEFDPPSNAPGRIARPKGFIENRNGKSLGNEKQIDLRTTLKQ